MNLTFAILAPLTFGVATVVLTRHHRPHHRLTQRHVEKMK